MKTLIMIVLLMSTICFGQAKNDSTLIADLEIENKALKELIVAKYVQETGKEANEAFIDLYFHSFEIEKQLADLSNRMKMASEFIGEIKKAESFSDVKKVLKKYGVE